MSNKHPLPIQRLINNFRQLPGIGPKSAERIVYQLLANNQQSLIGQLAENLLQVREKIKPCERCFCLSEERICNICRDPRRESAQICVVEDTVDLLAIDRTGIYHGRYHVLGGVLSPLDGCGPEKLKINSLLQRIEEEEIKEVLLATNANVEGDATAIYLQNILQKYSLKITRLASGVPQGGTLSYLDEATLSKAIDGRINYQQND